MPLRAAPAFGATVKPTFAFPWPLADVIVIHATFVVAVHAQLVISDSGGPAPPAAGTGRVSGARTKVHSGGSGSAGASVAACATVNDCPAIVSAATRGVPGLASTMNSTTPEPLPEDPDVILTQLTVLVAVHEHPAMADTVTR
jgi:hypothetical protein